MLHVFKSKYIHRKDIGNEYFEGDYEDMIKTIYFIRNNIVDTCEQEKSEKTEVDKIKEILDKQKRKEEIIKQKEEKAAKKQQKVAQKKMIEEEKEAKQQQKEDKRKQLEEEKIKEMDKRKKENIQQFLDWLEYSFNNNSLHNGPPRTSYLSYCDFMKDTKDTPMSETNFGIIMNNRDNSIPFKFASKKKTHGFVKIIFNQPNIQNWIDNKIQI